VPADAHLNRNKSRLALDLKDRADLTTARELVERADVLIENLRPGVMDRLGQGYEDLSDHSRLIHCSIPGCGWSDPNAATPSWEGMGLIGARGEAWLVRT